MAPKVFSCIGVAGSGKTHFGMQLLESKLREGLSWRQVAYTSYSRAACSEAARRAAAITGESPEHLQKNASYATIHALTLRAIGVDRKSILDSESSAGQKFISEACGDVPDARQRGTLSELIGKSLALWDLHRARLGCPPPTYSGFIPDNGVRHSCQNGVINASPDLTVAYGSVMTHEPDGPFRPAAHEIPVFYMAKLFPELFISPVCPSDETKQRACEILFRGGNPYGITTSFSEIPYVRLVKSSPDGIGSCGISVTDWQENDHNHTSETELRQTGPSGFIADDQVRTVVKAYENAKKLFGRLDFADILLLFLGMQADSELNLVETGLEPPVTSDIRCFICDEAQDLSPLLACAAAKLSEASCEAHFLGDDRQAVFGFSGSSGAILRAYDSISRKNGTRTLLNTSRRNPIEIIEWGEEVLNTDPLYESRHPQSEAWEDGEVGVFREGSVGLVIWEDFLSYTPELACSDVMILSRAWFSLLPVKDRLDSLGIPWRSCQEKQSSRWECPAKIAYTLAMRSLAANEPISEQDWRRITDTLPQKMDGKELFVRGTKSKWNKIACSNRPDLTVAQLGKWGATFEFFNFVMDGLWRREMFLLLDNAISQFGIDIVRNPRIRLGSVHSVKGLEARNVFCLSASTERCSGAEADVQEEICLKYVAITRASKNYRLVVNVNDIARSKPQFWAAPKGFWEFDEQPPKGHYSEPPRKPDEDGSADSGFDSALDDFEFRI
jgi:superfamily I DNA/RNA helicase